jgi:hypothetical protein
MTSCLLPLLHFVSCAEPYNQLCQAVLSNAISFQSALLALPYNPVTVWGVLTCVHGGVGNSVHQPQLLL